MMQAYSCGQLPRLKVDALVTRKLVSDASVEFIESSKFGGWLRALLSIYFIQKVIQRVLQRTQCDLIQIMW